MRRSMIALMAVLMVVAAACGAAPAQGLESIAQPTELLPPDDEVPVLYPPDHPHYEASLVLLIDEVPMAVAFRQLEDITHDLGGWISSTNSGRSTFDGTPYEYIVSSIDVPAYAFDDFYAFVSEIGFRLTFERSGPPTLDAGTVTVIVTLTDHAGPFVGLPDGEEGRVDQALDTAGDVLLTMLSVLIVGGAVVIPIALLAAIAYFVWRGMRRRFPVVTDEPTPDETDELVDA